MRFIYGILINVFEEGFGVWKSVRIMVVRRIREEFVKRILPRECQSRPTNDMMGWRTQYLCAEEVSAAVAGEEMLILQ